MISMLRKAAVAALAVAGLVVGASTVEAGSLTLGTSGWVASWHSSLDGRLGLNVEGESTDAVFVEKFATFVEGDVNGAGFINPLVITFQKTSTNAKPFIIINDEVVVNQTGQTWNGFRFTLLPGSGDVAFDAGRTDISPPGSGFSIDPFTTHQYSQNNTILEVGGGAVGFLTPDNVWSPGVVSGELAINTSAGPNNLTAFALKEQPLIGEGPAPAPIIPLPAAAWSGLSGLLGLALVSSRKHLRKLFA